MGEAVTFATLGAQLGSLPDTAELPPAPVLIQLRSNEAAASVRERFAPNCGRYAVIAMYAACEAFLVKLLECARLARALAHAPTRMIPGPEVNHLRDRVRKESRHIRLNDLIADILTTVGRSPEEIPSRTYIAHVYTLRTCLVHRGGTVSVSEAPNGELEAVWLHLALVHDGQEIRDLPHYVQEGGEVAIAYRAVSHKWRLGSRIELTAEDCTDVGMSLHAFLNEMAIVTNEGINQLFDEDNQEDQTSR